MLESTRGLVRTWWKSRAVVDRMRPAGRAGARRLRVLDVRPRLEHGVGGLPAGVQGPHHRPLAGRQEVEFRGRWDSPMRSGPGLLWLGPFGDVLRLVVLVRRGWRGGALA